MSAGVWRNLFCILELLFIRNHFYTLELFMRAEIDSRPIISHMCTVFIFPCFYYFLRFMCTMCTIFIINNYYYMVSYHDRMEWTAEGIAATTSCLMSGKRLWRQHDWLIRVGKSPNGPWRVALITIVVVVVVVVVKSRLQPAPQPLPFLQPSAPY